MLDRARQGSLRDALLGMGGTWLARGCALYGIGILLTTMYFFVNVVILGAVVWAVVWHARGRRPWPGVSDSGAPADQAGS